MTGTDPSYFRSIFFSLAPRYRVTSLRAAKNGHRELPCGDHPDCEVEGRGECDEYKTKRVVLEIRDEMKDAMDSGRVYQTRLDPPPADERVAHSFQK